MAASPNKAVSPKDYTVCIGNKTYTSLKIYPNRQPSIVDTYDLTEHIISYLPSYSIVGEFKIKYEKIETNLSADNNYIYCSYIINSDSNISNKCRYIRLIITPNILCHNNTTVTKNIIFNIDITYGNNDYTESKNINIFTLGLSGGGNTSDIQNKKYAVIYDLEKNEIYKDTDDPIEEWSDSNQLQIYV